MAIYDWGLPTVTTNYSTFVTELHNRLNQVATGFLSTDTHNNLATGTISFRNNKWQKWSGTVWQDLASTYSINISGNSSNISGTLAVTNGGTNITSYTVGDLLYASGSTALSRLTAVATGNVLISNGVSAAPSWGKVGLSTHISGTLSVSNGGTGNTVLSGILKGNGTGAISTATAGVDYAAANHTHSFLDMSGNLVIQNGSNEMTITVGDSGAYYYGNSTTLGWKKTGGVDAYITVATGDFTTNGTVTALSDIRLKSNINTIESTLTKVLKLRGVSYTKAGRSEIGVIAQEIESIIPEVVHNTGEYKSVAYANLVALLIEAIKELNQKLENVTR